MTAVFVPWLGLALTPLTAWAAAAHATRTRHRRTRRAQAQQQENHEIDVWLAQIRQLR